MGQPTPKPTTPWLKAQSVDLSAEHHMDGHGPDPETTPCDGVEPTKPPKTPRPTVWTAPKTPRPTKGEKTPRPTMNKVKTPRPTIVRDPRPTRQMTPRPTKEPKTK